MSKEFVKFNINRKKIVNKKVAIIKADFNSRVTNKMLNKSEKILNKYGINYDIYRVPGSFEVPFKIKKIAKKYDGFIAIGCLIKGETAHFECIAHAVTNNLVSLSLALTKPIGFAILTCQNKRQALARIKNVEHATLTILQLLS